MAYLLGVLVFAVGVALSIALHEVGHLVPAKLFGVKCTQYMVGFGPTVWSRKRGETEYGLKAIPLGGYVRMLGMFPPKPGEPARADTTGRLGMMIDQARRDAQREVGDADGDRLFYQRSVPKRLVIMLGGPTMNLVIAVVLLTVLVCGYGVSQQSAVLSSVSKCILPADAPASATCTATSTPAPAAAAGLLPGDRVLTFDGAAVSTWADVRDRIRASGGKTVTLVVQRGDVRKTLKASIVTDKRFALDADGNQILNADGSSQYQEAGFLGVTPSSEVVRQPITAVPGYVGTALQKTFSVVWTIPQKMVGVVQAVAGSGPRDPNGPVSLIGIGRVAGEVASTQAPADVSVGWWDRLAGLLGLIASLNLALFAFNLVPLLPLDGGHVAGALWEGLRRQVARLLKRPDPGPVDVARALPIAYGGGVTADRDVAAALLRGQSSARSGSAADGPPSTAEHG